MNHRKMFPLAAALCSLALNGAGAEPNNRPAGAKTTPAQKEPAGQARIWSQVVVEPNTTLTDKESRELSFAAGRVLKHVAQARTALAEGNDVQAGLHLDQTTKLMKIIDSVLPRYKMKTSINSGELVYSDEDEFSPEFITIFEELERRDIVSPVIKAKSEAAQKSAPQAADKNAPTAAGSAYVSQSDVDYTALKLDVDLTRRLLRDAKQSLGQKDAAQADHALATIQTAAVLFEYDEVDLPLSQAADNLKLAEAEMKLGRFDAAKAALHAAVDELQKYEKQSGETRSKEVRELHKEIQELTAQLDKGKPTDADAERHATRISGWWDRARKWFRTQ